AAPAVSEPLYEAFCAAMETELGKPISRGIFGADMQVALINDGPVTVWIDTRQRE
ncbi:MAG: D-aminoacyl-tRNA deacylase, partial [Verrucomicrobiota bacterium]